MKTSSKIIGIALISITSIASLSTAQTIAVSDNFDRADGSLVGTIPTPGPGAAWVNHSGTIGDLLISGGQAVVQHGVPSEDASVVFAAQTAGVVEATFDMVVNAGAVIGDGGGTDFEYFAHFFTAGSFNFRSRLDVVAPNDPLNFDYTLGISSTSSTAEAVFATDFNFGDTVSVLLSFDVTSGIGSLTVGSTTIFGTSSATGETIDAFALRQSDSSNNETVLVDNLVITTVPEPSTYVLALGALGLVVALVRRRR